MKSQIAQTMRGSMEYTWQGPGPVLLVCHGTSENCHSGSSLTPLLHAGFSLLTVSRPGYGRSSRQGALNDLTHVVTRELMQKILSPTLIIHSRDDASIPFHHAEWSLENIPNARLRESGFTGHFYWIGPDYQRICESMIDFLQTDVVNTSQILR